MTRTLRTLLLTLLLSPATLAQNAQLPAPVQNVWCLSDESSLEKLCVQSNYQREEDILTFCVSSIASGWLAFGIGQGMGDAKVFVGWNYGPLNNTSTTVSDRTSNSHRVPTTDTTSTLLIINNKTIADNFMTIPTHNTRIVFARSRAPPTTDSSKTKTLNLNGTTKFVYAYSNKPPVDPTQQTSSFFKHDVAGCFEADFLNPSNATRIGKEINCTTVGGTPNASYPAPISGIVNTGPSISKIYVANFSAYVNLQATNSVPFRISAGLIVGILGGIIACIILVMIYYYTRKKSRSFWVLE